MDENLSRWPSSVEAMLIITWIVIMFPYWEEDKLTNTTFQF